MKIQIRLHSQIQKIEYSELSIMTATAHFVNYGYEYLYVYKDGILYDVLSYHDFLLFGIDKRHRSYIADESEVKGDKLDTFLSTHQDVNRVAVVSSDRFRYEINLMTEPELLHSVERELFALRFIDLFLEEVSERLIMYRRILVLAPKHVTSFLIKRFQNNEFECICAIDNLSLVNITEYDAVIDMLCGPKIRKRVLDNKATVISIYEIMEEIALKRLVHYAMQRDILLCLYRIPDYGQIDNLHPAELNVVKEKTGFIELLKNEDYLNIFCTSNENKLFVNSRRTHNSIRYDNSIWVIQGDCKENGLNVLEGVRKSIPNPKEAECTVHFFGPCIVMGMLVLDEDTIPSLFELKCIYNQKNVRVENHGGLHGNNVLNSIAGALATPMKSKDVIVLFDFFNDLDLGKYIDVIDTYTWFNSEKSKEEVFFLDHPVHCNMRGNRVIANNIYYEIEPWLPKQEQKSKEKASGLVRNGFESDYDFLSYFDVSQAIGVKTYITTSKIVSSVSSEYNIDRNIIGVLVIYSVESNDWLRKKVSLALKSCTRLLLMYSFDHLCQTEQLKNLELCEKYNTYDNVDIIQLGHFFNLFNYDLENERTDEYINIAERIERGFIDTIIVPNRVKIRFVLRDVKGVGYEITNKIAIKKSKEAGMTVIML